MKKLILAVAVTAGFTGNMYASDNALDSLKSAVPLSIAGEIVIPAAVNAEEPQDKSSADALAELKAAVKAAQIPAVEDNGRSFLLRSFPAQTGLRAILAEAGNANPGFYRMSSGDTAVRAFAKHLKEEAEIEASYEEPVSAKAVLRVAAAVEKAFKGSQQFAKIQLASNDITENGKTDYQILIAQQGDGSFLVLAYTNSPWSGKAETKSSKEQGLYYRCTDVAGIEEYDIEINMKNKTAAFFDNNELHTLPLKDTQYLETIPAQWLYVFKGPDADGVKMEIRFNATRLSGSVTVNIGTPKEETWNAEGGCKAVTTDDLYYGK